MSGEEKNNSSTVRYMSFIFEARRREKNERARGRNRWFLRPPRARSTKHAQHRLRWHRRHLRASTEITCKAHDNEVCCFIHQVPVRRVITFQADFPFQLDSRQFPMKRKKRKWFDWHSLRAANGSRPIWIWRLVSLSRQPISHFDFEASTSVSYLSRTSVQRVKSEYVIENTRLLESLFLWQIDVALFIFNFVFEVLPVPTMNGKE